jgi:hypothetical protein
MRPDRYRPEWITVLRERQERRALLRVQEMQLKFQRDEMNRQIERSLESLRRESSPR